jgi:hypothetical protein
MLLTGAARFCYERPNKHAFCVAVRSTRLEGSTRIARINAARSRSSLLDFTGQKQSRYRRYSRREDRHHLQACRAHFDQAQCRKPHVCCSRGARNAPHRRRQISKQTCSILGCSGWRDGDAIRGIMLRRLRIFRRAPVFRRVMRRSFVPTLKFERRQRWLPNDG